MKLIIDWALTKIPKRFDILSFSELCKDKEWISLPSLMKLSFIEKNIQQYIFEDHYIIGKYIENIQNSCNDTEPKKMAKRIYDTINYVIEQFENHAVDERINTITTAQELLLQNLVDGKDHETIKYVDYYLKQRLDIVRNQKENLIYDERKGEQADSDYFNTLKDIYEEVFPKFLLIVSSNEFEYNEEVIKMYLHLFIETPNLEKSNSECYVPNTLPYLKAQLKKITSNRKLRISAILEIIFALDCKLIELRERLDSSKRILLNLDPKRYYAVKSNQMHIFFKEKSIGNIEALIKYVKKNFHDNRSKLVFPDRFEDTITDLKKFKKIIEELKLRSILTKNEKGLYVWRLKAWELGSLMEYLEQNSLLNIPLKSNHTNYSNLFCAYFNVKFTPRALLKTMDSPKTKKFDFISSLK